MPGGYIVGVLFFLLLSVAAVTSMVGLIEPLIAWLSERLGLHRRVATLLALASIGLCSCVSALSFGAWSDIQIAGMSLGAFLDFVPNQILLPLGGLLIAVFAGWQMSRASTVAELGLGEGFGYRFWRVLVRFPVPLAIAIIFITGLA